jgi:hypothetical protein
VYPVQYKALLIADDCTLGTKPSVARFLDGSLTGKLAGARPLWERRNLIATSGATWSLTCMLRVQRRRPCVPAAGSRCCCCCNRAVAGSTAQQEKPLWCDTGGCRLGTSKG